MKLFVVPLACIAFLFFGCERASEEAPVAAATHSVASEAVNSVVSTPASTPAPIPASTVLGPAITFEVEERDFGTIWDFQKVTTTFPFINTGTKTLVISRLQAGCGCTVPIADKTVLKPGETGVISVTFDPSGKANKQDKKVTIFSNAVNDSEKGVWIRSYVNQFVNISNKFLQLNEMELGEPHFIEFDFVPSDPNFKILSMSGGGKHGQYISAEELEIQEGSPRRIRITVSPDMPWGAFHSQLHVKGEGTTPNSDLITHEFTVLANGKSFGKLRATQHIMSIGSKKAGSSYHIRNKLYRSDGEPFKVLNTAVLQPTVPGINFAAMQNLDGSYDLIVTGTLPASHKGSINAELMVHTDLPGQEEVLKIRLTGVVPKR